EGAGGARAEEQVVVREGEQSQTVAVVLDAPSMQPITAPIPEPAARPAGVPWKTVGWALGGAGGVGLGVGAISGLVALGDKNGAQCNSSHQCDPNALHGARTAAIVSDIGFIAGGLLLGGGVALIFFAPNASGHSDGRSSGVTLTAGAM